MQRILFLFLLFSISLNSFAEKLISKYTIVNGHKLHYYKIGSGKPLVLLPGYAVTSNFWSQPFINCLAQNRTVYLFDYQGVNTNQAANPKLSLQMLAQDIDTLTQQLKLNKPELVGWSMGGATALATALAYPKDFVALTLISPVVPNKLVFKDIPKPGTLKTGDDILNYVFNNNIYHYQSDQLPKYKQQILGANVGLFPDAKQNQLELSAMNSWVNESQNVTLIKTIRLPIKLILADNDAILNPKVQAEAFKNSPNVTTDILKNSGHASFYQYPENICKVILK